MISYAIRFVLTVATVILAVSGAFATDNVQFIQLGSNFWLNVNDIDISGDYAYCAMTHGMMILDITDLNNPEFLSKIYLPEDRSEGIDIDGNYAYIAQYSKGLTIIDITDPGQPFVVANYPVNDFILDVKVTGNYAYVPIHGEGVEIIDISDPAVPTQAGSCPGTHGDYIDISGNYAFIIENESFYVIDISNPAAPFETGSMVTIGQSPRSLCTDGNFVYLAMANQGVEIIDVSTPSAPVTIGSFDYDNSNHDRNTEDIMVAGDIAYVANDLYGMTILDISDRTNPRLTAHIDQLEAVRNLTVLRNVVIASSHLDHQGLHIIDISDPGVPVETSEFPLSSYFYTLSSDGNIACMGSESLIVTDISNPSEPVQTAALATGGERIHDMIVHGSTAYFIDEFDVSDQSPPGPILESRLCIADLTDTYAPFMIGNVILENHETALALNGDYLYAGHSGLQIVNISESSDPEVLGYCDFGVNEIHDISISGNSAFLACGSGGVIIVDISDPEAPLQSGIISGIDAVGVATFGNYAYIAGNDLLIYNVSNPAAPILTGYNEAGGDGLAVNNSIVYLYSDYGELKAFDVSDPTMPVEAGTCPTPGNPTDIAVNEGSLLVADYHGMVILGLEYAFPCVVAGDANHDNFANIGDAVFLIAYIFKGGPPPLCPSAGDINNDCQINVGDAVTLIGYIFNNNADKNSQLTCSECIE